MMKRWRSTVAAARQRLMARGLPRLDASALVRYAFDPPMSIEAMLLAPMTPMSDEQRSFVDALAARRLKGEPLAYVLGTKEFWSLSFKVTPATLIPRPETERLLDILLQKRQDKQEALRVLDLGTGSGCLLVAALTEYPRATGVGVDVSAAALDVASSNATALGVATRARFMEHDMTTLELHEDFDVVLCNPPYIAVSEVDVMDAHVLAYEPHSALFADNNGLAVYEALITRLLSLVAPGGDVLLEVGFAQASTVASLFEGTPAWSAPRIVYDFCGVPRCVAVQRCQD
ncbi:hypothetical protein SPRG_02379 [Saprolegnia parasitica CBS 223.65]|uniref:peptide chain release factor N(5)-glutamine methyltransferase n=1 Tax=Saprolegnia parasitica (strain CBS 223.65) TaxID=695850 RepID=A0A067CPT8_SAPPC|nr:hypothetical protein SPRG_02379 [Saprolegnia parasitica CBS 223.65]KDO32679.1 hypothetical protein SPRG_02379 [Saprolegnia parasitica CBS 223.65]|eukprot:XP_012196345.1 hypothetical protein SPRG_02379 [Saprolegnia parasitica CBS 223.65]